MSGAMQTELRETASGVTMQFIGSDAPEALENLVSAMKTVGIDIPNTVATNVAEELVTKTPSVAEVVKQENVTAAQQNSDTSIASQQEEYGSINPSFAFNNDDPIKTEGNSRSV